VLTPSPVSPRLMKTPRRATLSPKGARAVGIESTLPSPSWGRGAGSEGVPTRERNGYYVATPKAVEEMSPLRQFGIFQPLSA